MLPAIHPLGQPRNASNTPRTTARARVCHLGAIGAISVLVLVALHSASLLLPAPSPLIFPRADPFGMFAAPRACENGECFHR